MQDKDVEPDEDLCVKVNLYLSDSSEAASAAGASTTDGGASDGDDAGTGGNNGMDNAELLRIMQGALGQESGARVGTVPGSNSIPSAGAGQVRYINVVVACEGHVNIPSYSSMCLAHNSSSYSFVSRLMRWVTFSKHWECPSQMERLPVKRMRVDLVQVALLPQEGLGVEEED